MSYQNNWNVITIQNERGVYYKFHRNIYIYRTNCYKIYNLNKLNLYFFVLKLLHNRRCFNRFTKGKHAKKKSDIYLKNVRLQSTIHQHTFCRRIDSTVSCNIRGRYSQTLTTSPPTQPIPQPLLQKQTFLLPIYDPRTYRLGEAIFHRWRL